MVAGGRIYLSTWVSVLSVRKALSSFGCVTRRWPMYVSIRRSLLARPKPDNTFWTDSTVSHKNHVPLLPCISYGNRSHDFCVPLYSTVKHSWRDFRCIQNHIVGPGSGLKPKSIAQGFLFTISYKYRILQSEYGGEARTSNSQFEGLHCPPHWSVLVQLDD